MTEQAVRPIPWLPLAGAAVLGGAALAAYLIEAGRRGADELTRPSPGQPPEDPADHGLDAES
ncbi:MAG: hypothetical protein ACK46X_18615, partial [Candidatus Sericytochromatia bacterium]